MAFPQTVAAGQNFVKQDARRIQVGSPVDFRIFGHLLGRDVFRRSDKNARCCQGHRFASDLFGHAKTSTLSVSRPRLVTEQHQILRFYVSVYDTVSVGFFQRCGELSHHRNRPQRRQRTFAIEHIRELVASMSSITR